jgi:DNA-binding transcriptional MocR family regulator
MAFKSPTDPRDRGERWSALLGLLAEHGRLSVSQVSAELDVSEATVRRDFGELAAQQLVTRTHGGVVATSVTYELPARYKSALADDNKQRIAAPQHYWSFPGPWSASTTGRPPVPPRAIWPPVPIWPGPPIAQPSRS